MYIWEKNNNKSQVWLLRGQLGCRLCRTWFTGSCTFTMFYQVIENRKRKLSFSPDNHRCGGPHSTDNWPLGAPGKAVTCPDQSFLTNVRNRFGVKLLTAGQTQCCCGQALTATDWAGGPEEGPVVSAQWAGTRPDPALQCTVGMHPDCGVSSLYMTASHRHHRALWPATTGRAPQSVSVSPVSNLSP